MSEVDAMTEPVLEVRQLRIEARRRGGTAATIVSSLDLSVAAGETVGIVGESGSGKSMTARAIVGLLPPSVVAAEGEIRYGGQNLLDLSERQWRRIRGRELGLVMQDPFTMLNPVLRCGRVVEESLSPDARRKTRRHRRAESIERLAEVGIADETVVDRYPFQLSGGMRQRVAIAAAIAAEPRVLIADEPSTALDVTTQRDILMLLKKLQASRGMGLALITHDLRVAFSMCDRVYVLYAGHLVEAASAAALDSAPMHPYTHGLLTSEPPVNHRVAELTGIPGAVPEPDDVAGRCTFEPRCSWSTSTCRTGTPRLREVAPGHLSACVRVHEIHGEMAQLRARAEVAAPVPPPQPALDQPLVRGRDVRKVFDGRHGKVSALAGVSFEIGHGESVGLVGESGSGKTTLARSLVGLEHITDGELTVDGVDMNNWSSLAAPDQRRLRSGVQMVFQDPYSSLNPMHTIGWTLSEAIRLHDSSTTDVPARVGELLESVGLPAEFARRKPVILSGGQRQRVAIARALAVRPKLLVCDEPLSALDMSAQAQILNLLTRLHRELGIGYLFVTHDLAMVRQIVDRIYVLYQGDIVESGPVDRVLEHPADPYTRRLIESIPRSTSDWLRQPGDQSAQL